MIDIRVSKELSVWKPVIRRQLDLAMSALRPSLQSLRVRFKAADERGISGTAYRCEIRGEGADGRIYRVETLSADGFTAIADACARARRTVSRDRTRNLHPRERISVAIN